MKYYIPRIITFLILAVSAALLFYSTVLLRLAMHTETMFISFVAFLLAMLSIASLYFWTEK